MIDSHCHLDYEPLLSDLTNVIIRSKKVGIKKLLTISTSLESFSRVKELVNKDEMIYGTIGIHPHESSKDLIKSELIIKKLHENEKIIGIGETGLDFYYNNSEKEKQITSFEEHIKAAIKTNVPLIIHSRSAEDETFEILNSYFSASGIITFKNSNDLRETFKSIPLDKVMIETDSPYLAPVPNRGKKNEPSFIDFTSKKLAEIKTIQKSKLDKITTENFDNLFFK